MGARLGQGERPRAVRSAAVSALLGLALLGLPIDAQAAPHLEYQVLTPAGYESTNRSYPVVYFVPGSGSDSASGIRTLELPKYAARGEALIVVASELGDAKSNFIVDWFDGSKPLDTSFTRELIAEVDRHYRTLADGRHRAIAGYSAGGYSSMAIASRHPELFVSAGSFSGTTDLQWRAPGGTTAFEAVNAFFYGPQTANRRWGDPVKDQGNWEKENPAAMAARLHGKRGLYIAAGDGNPSSPQEAADAGPNLPQQSGTESIAGEMNQSYDAKLTSAGVAHVYRPHAGLHRSEHWRQDLAIWWPMAISAISGGSSPAANGGRACLSRRSSIGARGIGRVRLGYTRGQALRRIGPPPVRRASRAYSWCVKGSRGRLSAVFGWNGRIQLVTTTAAGHGMRRVVPGVSLRSFRRAFPRGRRLAAGSYRAGPRSRRLFGIRRGRVRFAAVAQRGLLRHPRTLRRFLRLADIP